MIAQGRDVVTDMRDEEKKTSLLSGDDHDHMEDVGDEEGPSKNIATMQGTVGNRTKLDLISAQKNRIMKSLGRHAKEEMKLAVDKIEKEKRAKESARERSQQSYINKLGMRGFRIILDAQY